MGGVVGTRRSSQARPGQDDAVAGGDAVAPALQQRPEQEQDDAADHLRSFACSPQRRPRRVTKVGGSLLEAWERLHGGDILAAHCNPSPRLGSGRHSRTDIWVWMAGLAFALHGDDRCILTPNAWHVKTSVGINPIAALPSSSIICTERHATQSPHAMSPTARAKEALRCARMERGPCSGRARTSRYTHSSSA